MTLLFTIFNDSGAFRGLFRVIDRGFRVFGGWSTPGLSLTLAEVDAMIGR